MIWHRRVFAFGLMLCLIALSHGAPRAQFNSFPPGVFNNKEALEPAAGGGGYTGPGDVIASAKGYWGVRCYSNAYSGNVADITDTATGNTTGTRLQCSSGTVSALVSGSACTFVTGNACSALATTCASSCNVVTLYDQSGNGNDASQATNANRPTYITSCQGSKPCLNYATQQLETLAAGITQATPATVSAVAERTANFTTYQSISVNANSSNTFQIGFGNAANRVFAFNNGAENDSNGNTDNVFHTISATFTNSAADSLVVDNGTATTGNTGANSMTTDELFFGAQGGLASPLAGRIGEVMLYSGAWSAGQVTSMCHNQFLYWTLTNSC